MTDRYPHAANAVGGRQPPQHWNDRPADPERLAAQAAGTRAGAVMDDITRYARGEIESWLEAAQAACGTAPQRQFEVLRALAATRSRAIREDLVRLDQLGRALDKLESQRCALRDSRRHLTAIRAQSRGRRLRRLIESVDDNAAKLLEVERRRAEIVGESVRVALSAASAAKALYGQVSALAGPADRPEQDSRAPRLRTAGGEIND